MINNLRKPIKKLGTYQRTVKFTSVKNKYENEWTITANKEEETTTRLEFIHSGV